MYVHTNIRELEKLERNLCFLANFGRSGGAGEGAGWWLDTWEPVRKIHTSI
ncbi:hypothetical protein V7O66_03370 [Methanolobus sp. ZRKC3]|uniref:hypothetical protein n=1 Tax=Methanolobus sp. ZRKC3 TaxID=3125786 RepID=UPI003255D5BB